MRHFISSLVVASAFLLSSFALSASAQRGQDPAQRLLVAAQNFQRSAQRVRGLPINQSARAFTRTVRNQGYNNPAAVRQRYIELRRFIHSVSIGDMALLDAWDEVVAAHTRFQRRMNQNQQVVVAPPVHQPPPPVAQAHFFEGSFENTPVRFSAGDANGIYQQCMQFARAHRFMNIDDIVVHGQRFRNGPSFWQNDALCSIAALNSMPHAATLRGNAEGAPFAVGGSVQQMRQILNTYLPRALTMHVDDVEINGQRYHNQAGFWNAQEVLQMVLSQMGGQPPRRGRRPGAPRVRVAR